MRDMPSRKEVYDAAKHALGNLSIGRLCGTLGEDSEEEMDTYATTAPPMKGPSTPIHTPFSQRRNNPCALQNTTKTDAGRGN